jgi:hypothetical protein
MAIRTRPLSISTQANTALFVHAASQMSIVSSGLIYVDNMPMRADFPPPDNTLPDPPGREMLHISRVSDAVLNGEWWYAGIMGFLDKPYQYQILDANISVRVKYDRLEVR